MGREFDLVVIGSGPAGEKGAAQVAYFGKRVALVEREPDLGGACANTGTLPSKTLRESALFLSGMKARELYGLTSERHRELTVGELMGRKEKVVDHEHSRIVENLHRHKITLVQGTGSLKDPHTVHVEGPEGPRDLEADVILVATGSHPYRPKEVPFGVGGVHDSDTILRLERIPSSLCVLGGGVIGCEYASLFAALGVEVHLIEGKDHLLGFVDFEVCDLLTSALRRLGIDVVLGEHVNTIASSLTSGGLRMTLSSGRDIACEALLAAAGRVGNTAGLGLADVGVKLDERGRILVDAHFQTSVPSIYAAGDVIGFPALASTSMEQARVAMCYAFDLKYKMQVDDHLPYGLYTIPEVSMVGRTEEDLKRSGQPYETGRAFYRNNARGQIVGDHDGMVKLVFDPASRKLLGVHILGQRATELVHVGQACMYFGGTIDYFINSVFNYPTLTETYKYAAYDGLGRLAKRAAEPAPSSLH
jgi:NAD(P) transhydrogenase